MPDVKASGPIQFLSLAILSLGSLAYPPPPLDLSFCIVTFVICGYLDIFLPLLSSLPFLSFSFPLPGVSFVAKKNI